MHKLHMKHTLTSYSHLQIYKQVFTLERIWFRIAWWSTFIYLIPCFIGVAFAMQGCMLTIMLTRPSNPAFPRFAATSSTVITWMNAFAETAVLLLPIPHVIALRMTKKKKKLGLIAVFCLGGM